MISMSALRNTASKASTNLVSRSRIRNRRVSILAPRSMARLRLCWVTQVLVGRAVTAAMCSLRVWCSTKIST